MIPALSIVAKESEQAVPDSASEARAYCLGLVQTESLVPLLTFAERF